MENFNFEQGKTFEKGESFVMVSEHAFTILNGDPYAFMIYCYLVKNYNADKGYAYPSVSRIQNAVGIKSNKTVRVKIDLLEEKKLIKIIRTRIDNKTNEVNKYVVFKPVWK